MTGPVTKVTEVRGAYAFEGTTYGPFQASKDKPFLEVPAQLATALGLPLHESEVQAREAAEADDADGADVEELIRANGDLKADVDALTQDRDRTQEQLNDLHAVIGWSSDNSVSAAELIRNIQGAAETNRVQLETATNEARTLRTRVTELENQLTEVTAQLAAAQAAQLDANTALQQADVGTALPDDFPHRDLLTEAGFTTVEAVRTGLQKTAGQEKSAVENISGIGPAALKKITEASR